ncbi:alpha-ketoglutarate dehydrogenase component 4 [Penaeus vannamei]|uniref:alpha-ketoglutarate dehydrogenase component 4 n=1 Tax=Penaeus vannamei TaxID=6689 RepID=UPI000F679857|nr:28S ribosomal protein S36, mitochondrial-like [Penaeus vannamei]
MQVNVNMSSVAGTAWRAVKPHIPMIKFRKGGLTELVRGPKEPLVAAAAVAPMKKPAATPVQKAPVLEEWQVPLKYRREIITEEEIEFINRGGPA